MRERVAWRGEHCLGTRPGYALNAVTGCALPAAAEEASGASTPAAGAGPWPVAVLLHGGYWRVPHDIKSTLLYTAALGLPRAVTTSLRAR